MNIVDEKDDRVLNDQQAPRIPIHPLTSRQVFSLPGKMPDLALLKDHLRREGLLTKECALEIIRRASAVLDRLPNILELESPVTVCGDVHGQFFDLIKLLDVGGDPKHTQYLFLGDYVDRGLFACEVVFYMYCFLITYPHTFHMLRGNHECRHLTQYFTFLDECTHKYDFELYEAFMSSFDKLPIAAIVTTNEQRFFCVHGGISPYINTLEEIDAINRKKEPPPHGGFCDLLWSDPNTDAEEFLAGDDSEEEDEKYWYIQNVKRECSFVFGVEAVKRFLDENDLTCIIRAHEAKVEGYQMHMMNPETSMPRVITIFSAPNYCDTYKNRGAVLKFAENVLNVKQFTWVDHPYHLPNFMNVFDWSLPFVSEKVIDMLIKVVEAGDHTPDEKHSTRGGRKPHHIHIARNVLGERGGILRKKVIALTQMLKIFKTLRKHNEALTQLKALAPSHHIPMGLLRSGSEEIMRALSSFENAEKHDRINERRPSMEDITLKKAERHRKVPPLAPVRKGR